MPYVLADPQMMATAAADLERIGVAVGSASAAAAGPTSSLAAAAADEVSAAIANLFGAYGREYQAIVNLLKAFQAEFARTLAAAGLVYAQSEATNAATVSASITASPLTGPTVSLIMGGSGNPTPGIDYVNDLLNYISPQFGATNAQALFTPEQLYPLTGEKSLPLTTSVSQGVQILHNAILSEVNTLGNSVVVGGYSQSAIIASLEMRNLAPMPPGPAPPADRLGFVLLANPMNPNGGLLSRFAGLSLPSLGVEFFGATPADTIYPTSIYTHEYDGFADFPRYPLNIVSDLNAIAGIAFVHTDTPEINPQTLPPGDLIKLPTEPTYNGNTSYYIIRTHHLPLLTPLRFIPVLGNPLADLVEPNLTTIVNLGYGDPRYGYSTAPANVPTPFGLFPEVDPAVVAGELVTGTQQGFNAAVNDILGQGPQGPPTVPSLGSSRLVDLLTSIALPPPEILAPPTSIDGLITDLQAANTYLSNTISGGLSSAYESLLPTADILNAGLTEVPSYNLNLFLDGIEQAVNGDPVGLINAIGYPIAADVGLLALAGGLEGLVLLGVVVTDF
ncbi:PE family protein [Mycobacterium kansasii]|uniref:PE family protein n=1 Tax=Mycobacterium kansasii TaxID=1768 RepID=UPI0009EF7D8A|nr:PE-PPE domain-containing protein [Mycobacterium kansasii]ARG81102.1 PE family protein [Mycobacterium kansasii]